MFLNKLSENIFESPQFKEDLGYLNDLSISVSAGVKIDQDLDQDKIFKLLKSAVHFSGADATKYKSLANLIAAIVSKLNIESSSEYDKILGVIWTKLGNFPTRNFILKDLNQDELPLSTRLRTEFKETTNTVSLNDSREIILTDFQSLVWDSLSKKQITTITAPTSAGKSYSLMNFMMNEISSVERFSGCYIVPTRALINQVSKALINLSQDFRIADDSMMITSIPIKREELNVPKFIYVLTQERLLTLLEEDKGITFDFIVIDEAQMLGDSSRGIILLNVLEQLRSQSPEAKILFGSPFTKNPSIFDSLIDAKAESFSVVQTDESPVVQNLIPLEIDTDDPSLVNVLRVSDQGLKKVGSINLGVNEYAPKDALALVSHFIGKNQKNLVYSDGPAECERIASFISQWRKEENLPVNEEVRTKRIEFSKFLRETIHPNYILADTVLEGVAFHYGNMPTVVRKTVENYFSEDVLEYLVCTSTLLHGVNFPAKNIFMNNPHRGDGKPLSPVDFWNLAGRAGRLGKDYEGNVYLLQLSKWESNPIGSVKDHDIRPSYYKTIVESQAELFSFIKNSDHASGIRENDILETTFQKLLKDQDTNKLDKAIEKAFGKSDPVIAKEFENLLLDVKKTITLKPDTYHKHVNISVYRQQELYDYFIKSIKDPKKGPAYLMPKHPLQEESYESYVEMVRRIRIKLERSTTKSEHYFAPWMSLWMKGSSLAFLIKRHHDYKLSKSKRKNISVATSIRESLEVIEQELRFRLVKFTRCYIDILAVALIDSGMSDLLKSIPNIPLYLELGACSKSMVGLLGLGLSRTTAGVVHEKMHRKDLTQFECAQWLKTSNLAGLGISEICIREIGEVVKL